MRRSLALALTVAAAGCSTPRMAVPAEISKDSDVIAATDRSVMSGSFADETFKLGKYAVQDVDRDWDSSSGLSVLAFSSENTEGGYSYKLKAEGVDLAGGCATEKADKSVALSGGVSLHNRFARLGCTCQGSGQPTKVVISSSTTDTYAGELQTNAGTYTITAIYEAEGSMSTSFPTGYRVDGDRPRGAVEVLKPGRVWFARDIEEAERTDLVCLYVGLMLYMPPDE